MGEKKKRGNAQSLGCSFLARKMMIIRFSFVRSVVNMGTERSKLGEALKVRLGSAERKNVMVQATVKLL